MRLATAVALSLLVSGCSLGAGMDSTGRVANYKSIDEVMKTIRKGVTTKEELVADLGAPSNDMMSSENVETLTFGEDTPFWKSGGIGSLFMGRQQTKTLNVTLRNGKVLTFVLNQQWVNH